MLVCSYLFYAYWDWRFCSLVALATIVVFFCGKLIYKHRETGKKKRYLIVSLVINLGILGLFKYYNFFIDSFNGAFSVMGLNLDKLHMTLILPLGISFYTFQSLTYVFGIYYDEMEPSDSFLNVALFVSFFPQLFAGPIERAKNILPQLKSIGAFNGAMFKEGLVLITLGIFKKVLIGDTCGRIVNQVFAEPQYYASIELIMGVVLYFVQIYADFSGYTNMARGTAKLLGINIMENFEQPYLTNSIAEFWRRWHISLSSWLRDYLFTPFAIATRNWGKYSVVIALIFTFTIVGLWHGAGWTFMFWGFLQGFFISFSFVTQKARISFYKKIGLY
ncbi:MAG: MBOAT family O-acyltransferase, partial [Candidatus Paceibacterales bacterium]